MLLITDLQKRLYAVKTLNLHAWARWLVQKEASNEPVAAPPTAKGSESKSKPVSIEHTPSFSSACLFACELTRLYLLCEFRSNDMLIIFMKILKNSTQTKADTPEPRSKWNSVHIRPSEIWALPAVPLALASVAWSDVLLVCQRVTLYFGCNSKKLSMARDTGITSSYLSHFLCVMTHCCFCWFLIPWCFSPHPNLATRLCIGYKHVLDTCTCIAMLRLKWIQSTTASIWTACTSNTVAKSPSILSELTRLSETLDCHANIEAAILRRFLWVIQTPTRAGMPSQIWPNPTYHAKKKK